MMRERRFGGDIRTRSPPRVASLGGRGYSPPLRQSRDLRNLSPTGATMKVRDYPHDVRTRSPPRVSMQCRETRDYQRPNHASRERHSHLCSERGKRSDYSWYLDEDRDRQLQNLSLFNDGLPQRDSPFTKFQWRHLFEKSKRTNDDAANHNSNHYSDYGIDSTRVTTERSYQSSGSADMGHSGTRVEKLMPLEVEHRTFPASYLLERGARRSNEIAGVGLLLQSQKSNMGLQKSEDLWFQSQMPSDKLPARDLYKGKEISEFYSREENRPFYSRDTSRYVIPSSQSKASSIVPMGSLMDDFHDSHSDGFPVRSYRFSRSSGMLTEPIPTEAYTHISQLKSSRDSILQLDDISKQRQVQLSPSDGSHGGYTYHEVRRSEKSEMPSLSNLPYRKPVGVEDGYGLPDSFGSRIVKHIKDRKVVTEGSHREHMIEGPIWDQYSSQEPPIDNYLDSAGSSYASNKDVKALGDISMHHEYEREVYGDHGNTYMREDRGSGRDAYLQPEDEILNMLLMKENDQDLDGIYNTYQEGFPEEELYLIEQPKRVAKRHRVEKELSSWNPRSRFSSDNEIHHGTSSGLLMNASRCRKLGRRTIKDVGCRNSNFVAYGGPSVRIGKSNVRDIKKRLGFTLRDIKKRLGPLRPVPEHNHIAQKRRKEKKSKRNQDGCHLSIHGEEEGPLEGGLPLAKSEPREESEEFKQLVHSAFLKFVKQLNENPAQRRRLKGKGKAGSLKCSVCGRESEEFLDTQSLALHACTALKVGMGAQHLGFHKAVCSLMGWKSAEIMNSEWVFQLLPDAETVALKEDLIIWPPLVIIHNSSLGNANPDGRVIVPVEMLEGMLRDMGFGEKTKVCCGKPANQGVMVVKFGGTFSGFQEAEKLHKIYADNKRGRTEFQRINPHDIQKEESANKVEEFLYGYLGIAEDLDKLDFDTKKRCLLRSKKAIQKIADALLEN